jgi:chromate transporter
MVTQKKYLTEEELLELYSLCQMLPGPSSTQTITSMGYKFGGPFLAFLTLLVWVAPAFVILTILALLYPYITSEFGDIFRFIQPLVVAFISVAAFDMIQKVASSKLSIFLIVLAFFVTGILRHPLEEYVKTPWLFPVMLVFGGVVSYFSNKDEIESQPIRVKAPWQYFISFGVIFIAVAILGKVTDSLPVKLFENTYRFGSLVFGGGNVLIPMIYDQFVAFKEYLQPEQFITGMGLVQAVPGPIFTISTFTCAMAMDGYHGFGMGSTTWQVVGATIGTIGIFLPGTLMIFFIYPVWDQIKSHRIIQKSLEGVIASSAGLVAAAAYLIFLPVGLRWNPDQPNNFHHTNLLPENYVNWPNIILIAVLCLLLKYTKIPAPVWVVIAIIAGIIAGL